VITFLLAEAELELMPPELQRAPGVVARAKKRRRPAEQLLLDQALDHKAMKDLPDGDRRGRPDIAHFWLMLVLDSLATKHGQARALIHTRHDELIRPRADLRIMRNQVKFVILMEDLLRQGQVPQSNPLLTLERGRDLASVLKEEARGTRILMDVGGELGRAARFTELARSAPDITIVTGGFPRGSFRQAKREDFEHVIRVADEELTVWSALAPVLAGVEDAVLDHAK